MKHGFHSMLSIVFCLVVAALPAWAAGEKASDETAPIEIQKNCNLNGYKSETLKYDPLVAIPDNNAAGVTLGPLSLPDDGRTIADVVLELKATHTYVGDLKVTLRYDYQCDGSTDAQAVLLCRPRGTQSTTPAPCGTGTGFGCSGNLSCAKSYKWDDSAGSAMAEGSCASTITDGCYKPANVGGSPLAAFVDFRKDGCWYLDVADLAAQDTGTVCEWTVHVLNHQAVGVEARSWSNVKVLFN